MYDRMLRFRYMITEEAKRRTKILVFWEKYGDGATKEAFGTSRRTLFRWQEKLQKEQGRLEGLNKKSTAPKGRRKRVVKGSIEESITTLRTDHPRLGKDKVHALLKQQGYEGSVSTIGRIIKDLKEAGRFPSPEKISFQAKTGRLTVAGKKPKRKKLRRPKGYRVLEVDTVVRFVDGFKRYVVTGVDTEKRTSFAACYTNHGYASEADFLSKCVEVLPDCPKAVQTDNGSEFALHFNKACDDLRLERFHTYPRSPKMNAHVERFNRTIDEEFLKHHRSLLRDDVSGGLRLNCHTLLSVLIYFYD